MERPSREETQRRWRQFEEDTARALDGKLTPGSGNRRVKGDVKSTLFRAECKSIWAYNPSHGYYLDLDLQWLEAIWNHTHRARPKQVPILALEFGNGKRLILIPVDQAAGLGHDPGEQILLTKTGRSVRLWAKDTLAPCSFMFTALEVPQKVWLSLSWPDLIELRRECQPPEPKPTTRRLGGRTLSRKR